MLAARAGAAAALGWVVCLGASSSSESRAAKKLRGMLQRDTHGNRIWSTTRWWCGVEHADNHASSSPTTKCYTSHTCAVVQMHSVGVWSGAGWVGLCAQARQTRTPLAPKPTPHGTYVKNKEVTSGSAPLCALTLNGRSRVSYTDGKAGGRTLQVIEDVLARQKQLGFAACWC